MDDIKKVYVRVNEFPKHHLQLLLTLPPEVEYSDSHDSAYNCNLLIVRNKEGYTRVYSMGYDVYDANDLRRIFTFGNAIA